MTANTSLFIAASMIALAATPAFAQSERPNVANETDVVEQPTDGDLVVTGSRVARSRLDTLAPVDVIDSPDLVKQGTPELGQALANMAPSINFPRPAIADGTDHIRPAVLRGLSPDQTLVLLNGTRRHASALVNVNGTVGRGSSAVDLNAIPVIAVDRIEILRDGASAQYGSDAIAGVINLRLREAREGGGFQVNSGIFHTHVREARDPDGRNVTDGHNMSIAGWQGFAIGAEGFLTLSAEYIKRNPTNRSGLDPRVTPTRVTARFGDPELETKTVFANFGMPVGDMWEIYATGGYQHRDGESAGFRRIERDINNIDLRTGRPIIPDGFLPRIGMKVSDLSLGGGLRGDVGGFKADFNVTYGRNAIDISTLNTLNGSLGPASPRDFYAGKLTYDQLTAGVDAVRSWDVGLARPLALALGAEYRREGYAIGAGEPASYEYGPDRAGGRAAGAQLFPGFRPDNEIDANRDSYAVYAELDAGVTPWFDLAIAGRYEDYSDFGSTANGKVSGRIEFMPGLALRATASTGFRAPSLQQQNYRSTVPVFRVINGVSTPVETQTFPVTDPVAIALGARPLEPEKSTNFSVGGVFASGGFELTIDAYQIKIRDRIVLSENILGQAPGAPGATPTQIAIYNLVNTTGATTIYAGGRFFINGVDTTTRGIDIVARYRIATGSAGRFDLSAAANFNETTVDRVPTTAPLAALPVPPDLFSRTNLLAFEEGTPGHKYVLSADWESASGFGLLARLNIYGSVLHALNDPALDAETGRRALLDMEARVQVGDQLTFALGGSNITDTYARALPAARNVQGAIPFSSYSPFGNNGRYLYARVAVNW
ncbi:TonB-dependent receptor [Blastomonas sp.]|uniref:TonB-dependent receptor plug domain-containing protein n=1 Tax=Blastomonas sp. TaxID=1909299 RepID=UPI00260D10CA|nr:TonB-dependent receptor [Blastomonas sp.]MDM7955772.1 TonB-dependent receptor [Blastomonas sp.]